MISSHHTHNTRGRMYSSSAAAAAEGLATDFEPSASAKALAFKALASAAERVAMDSPPADAAAEASAEDGAETGARPRRLSGSAVRRKRRSRAASAAKAYEGTKAAAAAPASEALAPEASATPVAAEAVEVEVEVEGRATSGVTEQARLLVT